MLRAADGAHRKDGSKWYGHRDSGDNDASTLLPKLVQCSIAAAGNRAAGSASRVARTAAWCSRRVRQASSVACLWGILTFMHIRAAAPTLAPAIKSDCAVATSLCSIDSRNGLKVPIFEKQRINKSTWNETNARAKISLKVHLFTDSKYYMMQQRVSPRRPRLLRSLQRLEGSSRLRQERVNRFSVLGESSAACSWTFEQG